MKGRVIFPKPGTVISIVGEETIGETGYVEMSATPNVNTLYVGITNMSKFKAAMLFKINMPEDFEI